VPELQRTWEDAKMCERRLSGQQLVWTKNSKLVAALQQGLCLGQLGIPCTMGVNKYSPF
jgi:hypothetical protein